MLEAELHDTPHCRLECRRNPRMGIAGMLSDEDRVIVCVEVGRNIQLVLAHIGFCPAARGIFVLQPTETGVSARLAKSASVYI